MLKDVKNLRIPDKYKIVEHTSIYDPTQFNKVEICDGSIKPFITVTKLSNNNISIYLDYLAEDGSVVEQHLVTECSKNVAYSYLRREIKAYEAYKEIEEDDENYKPLICAESGCNRVRLEYTDYCATHHKIERFDKTKYCEFPLCTELLSHGRFCKKHNQNEKRVRLGIYRNKDLVKHGLSRELYRVDHWQEFVEVMLAHNKWTTEELLDLKKKGML